MNALRRFWNNIPLSTQLLGFTSLLTLGVTLALTAATLQRDRLGFRTQLEDQADLMLDSLSLAIRDQLYLVQVNQLEEVTRTIAQNPDITLITTYDSKGVLLTDSRLETAAFGTTPDPLGQRLIKSKPNETVLDWQSGQLVAGRVVTVGNQTAGAIAIGFSTQPLDDRLSALALQSILIAALMILIATLVGVVLTRQVTRPLAQLTYAAQQMAEGKTLIHVEPRSGDEIGKLALAFEVMANRIKQRETDLRDLASGLEQIVRQRTAQLVKRNEELTIARQQAEEATQLKSQFLATVSHELRTPLNSIMGFSQLLLMGAAGDLNEKQAERLQRILRSGEELLSLINDLLDLSKIEAGRVQVIKKPFGLRMWEQEIAREFEAAAQKKNLAFESVVDPNLPEVVVGDMRRLRQIAANLLSNAIKFTEHGKISLKLEKPEKDIWTIVVSDTGIGIPSHAQEFIFDEFRQVDSSPQREYSGTGLGLAIVRKLTVLMGGTVRVQSKVGEGSTFTVQLPLITESIPEGQESA